MNRLAILFLLFAVLIGYCQSSTCYAVPLPEKHALIITIANYDVGSGWSRLHCDHDLRLMRETLIRQKFRKENITSVPDAAATKEGIKSAILVLVNKVKRGDHVIVHYSGHGQQMFDDNADELDQLDETLVAYGAPMAVSYTKYKGDKHIRDDEFGQWLDLIRLAIGPAGHLMVIIDSCNSGTASRGDVASRGGPAIVPDNWDGTAANTQEKEVSGFKDSFVGKKDENLRGPMIVFGGAAADQINYEIIENQEIVGSLTFAVCQAFNTMRGKISYRAFFAEVSATMAVTSPSQTPSMEGDADHAVFEGQVIPQQAYFTIAKIAGDSVYLDGGILVGASKGAKIEFYAHGTASPDQGQAIAGGEVVWASPFFCKVKLAEGKQLPDGDDSWAFITRRAYEHWSLNVAVEKQLPAAVYTGLIASLTAEPGITIADEIDAPFLFKPSPANPGSVILVRTADGVVMGGDTLRATAAKTVEVAITTLRNYAIGQFLKEIQFSVNPAYKVSISLSDTDPKIEKPRIGFTAGNLPYCKIGKPVWIMIENNGSEDFYYNIVDFRPNGIAHVLLPATGMKFQASELLLKKSTKESFRLKVKGPDGIETHRIFVSNRPFDLRTAFGSFKDKGPAFDPHAAGGATYVFEIIK